jgi:hypothetical protein
VQSIVLESEQTHLVREGLDLVVALEELLAFLGKGLGGLGAEGGNVHFVAELDEVLGKGHQYEHSTSREGRGVGGTTRHNEVPVSKARPRVTASMPPSCSARVRQRRARATLAEPPCAPATADLNTVDADEVERCRARRKRAAQRMLFR